MAPPTTPMVVSCRSPRLIGADSRGRHDQDHPMGQEQNAPRVRQASGVAANDCKIGLARRQQFGGLR